MAVQQPVSPIGDTAPTSWADDVDDPIRLARFPCCGRYGCRCGEEDGEVGALSHPRGGGIGMGELTQGRRLALAANAQVAAIRADEARERAGLIERRVRPVREAVDRFVELHGRPPGVGDGAMMDPLLRDAGAGGVTREDLEAAARLTEEVGRASGEAADAMRAVADAMEGTGGTLVEWVGVDEATFNRVVEQALEEG